MHDTRIGSNLNKYGVLNVISKCRDAYRFVPFHLIALGLTLFDRTCDCKHLKLC